jgi:putative serine protease PepD
MSAGTLAGPPSRGGRVLARARWSAGLLLGALAVLTACTGGNPSSAASAPSSNGPANGLEAAYQRVITTSLPSVVEIRTRTGLGSGIVYDDRGDIVTNAHVVGNDRTFQVLSSGNAGSQAATLVGSFPANDLAVIRVTDGKALKPATFGDSSQAKVGDIVLAMGNPLGLQATVTNGIVSAVGRTVSEPATPGSPGATLPNAIQTSAPINPGNSGGALVDLDSAVIGIPTLAAVDPQAGGAAPGIGFAIPSNQARHIADQLIATGKVTDSGRAALGARVTTVVNAQGQPQGVGVVEVTPGGPADQAGIRAGDIIVSVNGDDTPTTEALGAVLAGLKPEQTVPVVVQRGGSQNKLQVTLGNLGG